jgi:hypothetical protein
MVAHNLNLQLAAYKVEQPGSLSTARASVRQFTESFLRVLASKSGFNATTVTMPQVGVTKSTAYGREMSIVEIQPLSQRCIDLCLGPQRAAAGRGGGAAARQLCGATARLVLGRAGPGGGATARTEVRLRAGGPAARRAAPSRAGPRRSGGAAARRALGRAVPGAASGRSMPTRRPVRLRTACGGAGGPAARRAAPGRAGPGVRHY